MRTRPDPQSPWRKRIYFENAEFETMMDDLRFRAGNPFEPGRGVDIERVLLRGLDVEADYVSLPAGVLGRTLFHPDGTAQIEVSRELSDAAEKSASQRHRLRSTLAHECGHVACHSLLFIRDTETLNLFKPDSIEASDTPPILCREEAVREVRYAGEWWEYQANQCMAALLMPGKQFGADARAVAEASGYASISTAVRAGSGDTLIRELSATYDVSLTAAVIRLEQLSLLGSGDQRALKLG